MAKYTKEQIRQMNSDRMKARWAAKRAATPQQTPADVASSAGAVASAGVVADEGLNVNVKVEQGQVQQPSLKDRILGKLGHSQSAPATPTPAKKPAARGKKAENLVTTAMPSVVCAFIATYSRDLVHDPYKVCAPSQDEVTGILGPLFDILGREVELTGKASQNTIDLINSLLCGMMYGFRAFMTYRQIKELESPANGTSTSVNSPISGLGSYPHSTPRPVGNNDSNYASSETRYETQNDAQLRRANTDDGNTEGEDPDANLISAMFKRDIEGRRRLGLLPGAV